jgi:hypothetical protein
MQEQDFPALYRSADDLSLESQTHFFRALKLYLVLLVFAAMLSITSIPHWSVAVFQLLTLLGALSISIYCLAVALIVTGMRDGQSPNRSRLSLGVTFAELSLSKAMTLYRGANSNRN